jgi:hypothetical protein
VDSMNSPPVETETKQMDSTDSTSSPQADKGVYGADRIDKTEAGKMLRGWLKIECNSLSEKELTCKCPHESICKN